MGSRAYAFPTERRPKGAPINTSVESLGPALARVSERPRSWCRDDRRAVKRNHSMLHSPRLSWHAFSSASPYRFTHRSFSDHHWSASYLAVLEEPVAVAQGPGVPRPPPLLVAHLCRQFRDGVVSGLVMAYQFGTNWSPRPLPAASRASAGLRGVLTAFFLEAGFLGVMLFGWNKGRLCTCISSRP